MEFDRYSNPVMTTTTPTCTDPVAGMDAATDVGAAGPVTAIIADRSFDQHGTSVEKTLSTGDGTQTRSGGTRDLDALGRTVSETGQDGDTTSYEYTVDGLVAKAVTVVRADHDQHVPPGHPGPARDDHHLPGRGRRCRPGTSTTRPPVT